MIILSITYILSGLLITLVTVPLIYRQIPMNGYYGMRVPQTFTSNRAWLDLNEIGGMMFSMLGFPLILSGVLGFFLPDSLIVAHSVGTMAVFFVAMGFAVYLFMRYAIRYNRVHAVESA